MRLIKEILNLLLGYRYKAVVLKDRGVERYWICSYIFEDTPEGNERLGKYLRELEARVNVHTYYETVTFRSRHEYGGILKESIAERQRRRELALRYLRNDTEEMRRYTDGDKRD